MAPIIGAVADFGPMFPCSAKDLERSSKQTFRVPQALLGFPDGGAHIVAPGRDSERTSLGELLSIPLYVFGNHRQRCGKRIVHRFSLAHRTSKSRLPGRARCRYRGALCTR